MRMVWLAVVFVNASLSYSAETRTWTDATGARIEGIYNKELLGGVQIKDQEGKSHLIRMEQLSKVDLDYITYHVPPKARAKVDVETQVPPRTAWATANYETTDYRFSVNVEKTSKLPYKGRLSSELFVVAKERSVQRDNRLVLMGRVNSRFVFPEDESDLYESPVSSILFIAYRAGWINVPSAMTRGKEYLGYIIAISDSSGSIIFCDTDITGVKWLTDDLLLSVEKLRGLYVDHPGSVESRHFNDSFKKISPPRVPWFKRTNHD